MDKHALCLFVFIFIQKLCNAQSILDLFGIPNFIEAGSCDVEVNNQVNFNMERVSHSKDL